MRYGNTNETGMFKILDETKRFERAVDRIEEIVGRTVRLRLHAFAEFWSFDRNRYDEIRNAIKTGMYTEEAKVVKAFGEGRSLLVEFPSGNMTVMRTEFLKS